jgi:hypothetical protein
MAGNTGGVLPETTGAWEGSVRTSPRLRESRCRSGRFRLRRFLQSAERGVFLADSKLMFIDMSQELTPPIHASATRPYLFLLERLTAKLDSNHVRATELFHRASCYKGQTDLLTFLTAINLRASAQTDENYAAFRGDSVERPSARQNPSVLGLMVSFNTIVELAQQVPEALALDERVVLDFGPTSAERAKRPPRRSFWVIHGLTAGVSSASLHASGE